MKLEKKHFIFGGLAVVSTALALGYWQYTKLMNYCIKLARIKFNTLSLTSLDFDLFLAFTNNSDLTININSQEYTVYVNNKEFVKVTNPNKVVLKKNSTSEIPVNLKLSPKGIVDTLKTSAIDILSQREKVLIRFDIKLKVSLFMIPISIPYVYNTNLKELTEGKESASAKKPSGKKC